MLALLIAAANLLYQWCGFYQATPTPQYEDADVYHAEAALCSGKFAEAESRFRAILPHWEQNKNSGRSWIDVAQGYYFALLAEKKDSAARSVLSRIEQDNKWQPSAGDRLVWRKSIRFAIASYASESEPFEHDPGIMDPIIAKGAAAAMLGQLDQAVQIWSQAPDETGATSNPTLKDLLVGDVQSARGNWAQAFDAWYAAARDGHAVMEYDYIDGWSLSALEMTWYYRNHDPRRAH
jgi:hypothetical protein